MGTVIFAKTWNDFCQYTSSVKDFVKKISEKNRKNSLHFSCFLLNLKLVLGVVHELRRFRIFGPPLSVWHFLPYERWQKSGHLWTTYPPKPTPLVNVVCERPLKEDTFMWEVSLIIIETTIIPGRKCFGQDMCSTWLIRNAKKKLFDNT